MLMKVRLTRFPFGADRMANDRRAALDAEPALAARPQKLGIEATSRDTEHLAHQSHRSAPSVFRNDAELNIDSLVKKVMAFSGYRTQFNNDELLKLIYPYKNSARKFVRYIKYFN